MENFDWLSDYTDVTSRFPNHEARPVIGITGNFGERGCELAEGYFRSIETAGGIPVVLPPTGNASTLLSALDRLDGVLFSGGGDINPLFLGEDPRPELHSINARRDRGELLLARLAYDRQLPLLGICRGLQVMVAALGGTLFQDIAACRPTDVPLLVKHSQELDRGTASHFVEAEDSSLMAELFGRRFAVNSFHHQAVDQPGPHFRVTAHAADGVIEAVESTDFRFAVGVQWHPECFYPAGNDTMLPLFRHFVGEADLYRRARRIHSRILTLDSHCDTPMFFDRGVDFDHRDPKVLVDLHKMTEGGLDATIMVAYLPQEGRSPAELEAATRKADALLDGIETMVAGCRGVDIAHTPDDLYRLKHDGLHAVMPGIENGYAIGRDLSRVAHFRRRGVVYMTLCHNGDNDICDSARRSCNEHGGVSHFGADVIAEMNRVGMMVDLSHGAEKSFYDAIEISRLPIVCSHASARALCDHPRNLTDDQLRALSRTGGVAQVTLYHGFLRTDGEATIVDAVDHLCHMIDVAGIDHVGIGTDFDGDGGIRGCASASELLNFTRHLLLHRFSEADLEKIWGGNFLRVMRQGQQAATDSETAPHPASIDN